MNYHFKHRCLKLVLISGIILNPGFVTAQIHIDTLILESTGKKIQNVIDMYLPKSDYEAIKIAPGEKLSLQVKLLIINGDTLEPEEVSTRGQTTLQFRRKSYGFRVGGEAHFRHDDKKESLKRFLVLSLSLDKYYCHNRLAFEMMERANIFHLFYSYSELRINGQSEGICMIVERPGDWAIKKKDSPVLIRRGYNHNMDKIETDNTAEHEAMKKYSSYFRQIYSSLNKSEGEELYKKLSEWIDLENYMRWIAFNLLVRNGDYSDEVFFYIDPKTDRFRVIPWDYDDIFAIAPHEGNVENRKVVGNKPFFSTEDLLDKKIASDPYLYSKYLVQLKEVLDKLSPEVLKKIFESTYAELYPYFSEREIISNSQYDFYKDANLENLRKDLAALHIILIISRRRFMEYIEKQD